MVLSWCRNLLEGMFRPARPRRAPCRRFRPALDSLSESLRSHPALEPLEERCVPAFGASNLATLSAFLNGAQETPPEPTAATGQATVIFNPANNTVSVDVTVNGIALANVTAFHFHRAPFRTAGPIILGLLPTFGTFTQSGNGIRFQASNIPFPAADVNNLLQGKLYLNIHTTQFPGGEIRGQVLPQRVFSVGPDAGAPPNVEVLNADGTVRDSFFAYGQGFLGGVRVATGDVNGDGVLDIITGTATGAGHVKVFDGKSGNELFSFFAYGAGYAGGLYVGAGDVNGDGKADIIVGTASLSNHVKVFDGATGTEIRSFFAYPGFTGGVSVVAGDVNGDGKADIITGTATLSNHVKVFDGVTGAELQSYFAYGAGFTGGVSVAAGDFNFDGRADIITGAGAGAGPHVKVFNGKDNTELASFFAFSAGFQGGVRVAAFDAEGDGRVEAVVAPGSGASSNVKLFKGPTITELESFFAFAVGFIGGTEIG